MIGGRIRRGMNNGFVYCALLTNRDGMTVTPECGTAANYISRLESHVVFDGDVDP